MFSLELDKVLEEIRKKGSKRVLIQLPDGLKPRAAEIVDFIEKNSESKAFIWLSSCYGGCDLPTGIGMMDIDLMIQFGHTRYNKTHEGW
ncbi:MAG: diphthamide synthesis protein [Nanoarchaeota archaeon]